MSALDNMTLEAILAFQTELVHAAPELGPLMDLVVRRAQALTGTEGAVFELAEDGDLVYRAVAGLADGQLGLRVAVRHSLTGLALETRQPQICGDSETDDRVDRAACRRVGLRSMVIHPLFEDSRPIGALKVLSSRPGAVGPREAAIVERFAGMVGGVFQRAREWARLRNEIDTLDHLASHDGLTGLKNRSAFHERLLQALALAKRTGERVGAVLFDLDGLKAVNDTHGHQAGDFLIRSFGQRLKEGVRESDTAARLGGDEFGVLFSRLPDQVTANRLASQLAASVEGPLRYGEVEVALATSYGVAVAFDDGADPDALLAQADAALYEHKRRRGRHRPTQSSAR